MTEFTACSFPSEDLLPHGAKLDYFEQRQYLIDGKLITWDGELNKVISPILIQTSTGLEQKTIGSTPLLTSKEALQALDAAHRAYDQGHGKWPLLSVSKRIEHVERFLDRMKEKRSIIVTLLMWEIGKSLKDSEKEFDRTIDYIVDTIKSLKELDRNSSKLIQDQNIMGQVRRVPIGVALCMGPFNYPLNETFTTLFPALLMGNTVVFKPAKYGVLLIHPLLEAFRDCFPPGVINIIYGSGRQTVGALMESGKIDVFAFIGKSKGANELKKLHPKPHRLKAILGLDAKNPAIVLPDADLEVTINECITGTLSFNGQRCTALKILFVHKNIVDVFIKKLSEAIGKLKCGMPWDDGVSITPLGEPDKSEYLKSLVEDAVSKGAKVMNENGGTINNSFFYPAVLYPVNETMRIFSEEQFGPIIPILSYENDNEPIQYVVNSNFGQQLSLFGKDSKNLSRFIDAFSNQVGRININSQCQRGPDSFPFNGRKDSAEGTLSVSDALRVFSIRALVATKDTKENQEIVSNILRNRESAFLSTDYIF